jgi:hypothetical protein
MSVMPNIAWTFVEIMSAWACSDIPQPVRMILDIFADISSVGVECKEVNVHDRRYDSALVVSREEDAKESTGPPYQSILLDEKSSCLARV